MLAWGHSVFIEQLQHKTWRVNRHQMRSVLNLSRSCESQWKSKKTPVPRWCPHLLNSTLQQFTSPWSPTFCDLLSVCYIIRCMHVFTPMSRRQCFVLESLQNGRFEKWCAGRIWFFACCLKGNEFQRKLVPTKIVSYPKDYKLLANTNTEALTSEGTAGPVIWSQRWESHSHALSQHTV